MTSFPLRNRLYTTAAANPPAQVPDAQRQALDRKHALAHQQRAFDRTIPSPHFQPKRPPG